MRETVATDSTPSTPRSEGPPPETEQDEPARAAAFPIHDIFNAMDQGILVANSDTRIIQWNRRLLEILRVPESLLTRQPYHRELMAYMTSHGGFLPEDVTEINARIDRWLRIPEKDRPVQVYARRRPDGMSVEVRTVPLPQGGYLRTFTDISEATRAETELRVAKEAAEDALARLTATQETLFVAEKMASLGQLVAGIAHEINTPIGTGLTAASLLAEKTQGLEDALASNSLKRSSLIDYVETARESSGFILSNLSRAAELIQSFKQVSVDQTSDDRRQFELRAYLEEILISLQPRLKRGPHDLLLDCPDGLEMDSRPGALFRIVTNLVVNALTHGLGEAPDAEPGTMALTARPDGANHVLITFSDSGRGIPADHLTKVFDPFFTTRRGKGGTGLGLNIVYNLVTQTLGGRISVQSTPVMGTTFSIRLPRALAEDPNP